ncbi:MAG TPA: UTP--glucose-1-phosphate uridylyltransferase [Tepidisphaeraceae bacterium]|jgi:UTP--glucose-1-phosphate uridylyltransferase
MITKTVIPAAGFGTRMLPAAKAVPKELLPILDRPTIQYVVEEAADAGIEDVLLITSHGKRSLEDHFDRNAELEQRLAAGNKTALLRSVDELIARVKVHSVRQAEQKGLGHAVLQARRHVGDQPFLCQLGDAIFSPPPAPASGAPAARQQLPAAQLVAAYEQFKTPIIGLERVPQEKVDRYGIVGGDEISPGVLRLNTLVEKPSRDAAPSNFAICARYLLTPDVFECLDRTPPGKGGEIQLTDAIKLLLERTPIHGVVLHATRHDIGNPTDWLRTNLVYARRNPEVWTQIAPLLKELLGGA